MTSQQILQSDFLDILFEKRNKLYGAYSLRRNYPVELIKAMGITSALVLALIFLSNPSSEEQAATADKGSIDLIDVNIPDDVKPEPPKPKVTQPQVARTPVKTEVFTNQVKVLEVVKDPVATQSTLNTTVVGNTSVEGPSSTGLQPPPLPPTTGGTGTTPSEPEKVEPPLPSRAPQFPGGTAAWLNFLGRHLRPVQDLEPGEKRSCMIRFSVDEEGAITNFQVMQSGGSEFDNEVIRVLKKMPKWLPAIQNGKPIAVSFTQPVTFVAPEE
ncbi:MAG: energy transducer TonB [Chitinophagaceae bacterium]|nr:MAG: energy transducer TonB [Chitinophagaceae bacterium]